ALPAFHSFPTRRSSDLLAHLEQQGLSLRYRAQVKSTISNFAHFLIEEKELLQRNPTRGIDLPSVVLLAPRQLSEEQRVILRSLRSEEHTSELQSRVDIV